MNFNLNIKEKHDEGFTLLELLIVVSIIAILSVALVLVLNPAEALKKSRDAQRISDMSTMKTALGLMLTSTSTPSLDGLFAAAAAASICTTGTTGNVASAAKIAYSASTAPTVTPGTNAADVVSGVVYSGTGRASGSNAGDVAGSGWIPAVLSNLTGGSPISNYPIDPTNTVSTTAASTDLVYRYACQNAGVSGKPGYVFEIDAQLESDAYTITENKRANDGGDNTSYYEVGTSLKLLPTVTTF
ncbi:MAG: prepilin-type N-terminal cleavage/methylation domain-containing protein [Candidatus Yonathbacteria bacterium]|nr:prepilin-type N-terminal cleavage/methylation domain-containing protein [Candidatus Yonathbacteria bacterium]